MATTRWEMPKMKSGHTVIDLSKTGSQTSWSFAPDEDVVFIGATTTRTLDRIYVSGGHNVAIVGGKYEPRGGDSATIHVNNLTGNLYVEGVHIDHKNAPSKDGIGVAGAAGHRPNVYVQNTIIDGITGTQNGVHGDMFQRYGQLGDIKMYNLSGSTDYQGLFLNPHPGYEIRSVELENVDIVKLPGGDARTWTYYFYSPGQNEAYPVKLTNVFSSDGNVFPPPGYQEGAQISGSKITFPNDAFSGHMTLGRPGGGDFVKPGDIGLGYERGDASAPPPADRPTSGGDNLIGTRHNDDIWARGGNDDIDGRAGNDVLKGGTGRDHAVGGTGADVIYGNEGNDRLGGNNGNDRILGGAGADTLIGGAGSDRLTGGAGNDRLIGGAGADQFVIAQGGDDVIVDFNRNRDVVRIDDAQIGSFRDVRDHMDQVGGNTVIDLGQGDSVTLLNCSAASLRADDFIFG